MHPRPDLCDDADGVQTVDLRELRRCQHGRQVLEDVLEVLHEPAGSDLDEDVVGADGGPFHIIDDEGGAHFVVASRTDRAGRGSCRVGGRRRALGCLGSGLSLGTSCVGTCITS